MDIIYSSVCGIDVHQHMLMCTIVKVEDGKKKFFTKEFKNFPKNFPRMRSWMKPHKVERVLFESTGIYWNSLYDDLTEKGYEVDVINAFHVKNITGKKTDVLDSQWIAELGACGLLRASFIPPREIRSIRLLARYRTKTIRQISSEQNRMYKVLEYSGIRLTYAMSKADCVSGMAMIRAIANGERSVSKLMSLARGSLRQKTEEFSYALSGKMTEENRFVLQRILDRIDFLKKECSQIEEELFIRMKPYERQWHLLQTIPGIDELSAALLIAEIGGNVKSFKNKGNFCSWMGICPSNNESAGKKSLHERGKRTHM